jgi:hypothetical protein
MGRLVKHRKPFFVVFLLLLVGCAGPLTMNKIQHIEQGMPSDSLSSMVERKPTKVFTVVDPENGLEYQVEVFPMQTDTVMTTTYTKYMTYTHTYPVTRDYAFLFRENSLLFWGFPHEFGRSDKPSIRRLAPLIIEALEKGK